MELSNYSVRIPEGRELESGQIELGTRREFSLELGNSGEEPVDADISICGEDLGTWPVRPGRKTVVELSEDDLPGVSPEMDDSAQPTIEVRFIRNRDQEIVMRIRPVFSSRSDSTGAPAPVGKDNEAFSRPQASSPSSAEETVLLNLRATILGRACMLYQTDDNPVEPGKIGEGIDRHLEEVLAFCKEQIQRNAAIIHREQFGTDTTTDPWDCIEVEGPKNTTAIDQTQSASFPNVETIGTISVKHHYTKAVLAIEALYETHLSGAPIQSNYNKHNGKFLKEYEVAGRILKHVRSASAYNLETDTIEYLMLEDPSSLTMRRFDSRNPDFPFWHFDEQNEVIARLGIPSKSAVQKVDIEARKKEKGKSPRVTPPADFGNSISSPNDSLIPSRKSSLKTGTDFVEPKTGKVITCMNCDYNGRAPGAKGTIGGFVDFTCPRCDFKQTRPLRLTTRAAHYLGAIWFAALGIRSAYALLLSLARVDGWPNLGFSLGIGLATFAYFWISYLCAGAIIKDHAIRKRPEWPYKEGETPDPIGEGNASLADPIETGKAGSAGESSPPKPETTTEKEDHLELEAAGSPGDDSQPQSCDLDSDDRKSEKENPRNRKINRAGVFFPGVVLILGAFILTLEFVERRNQKTEVERLQDTRASTRELWNAWGERDLEKARIAIRKGASLDLTPLQLSVAQLRAEGKISGGVSYDQKSLLSEAIEEDEWEFAKLLIESGAGFKYQFRMDIPPLHQAALLGRLKVVKLLLEKGADPSAPRGGNGKTPLEYALSPSNHESANEEGKREAARILEEWIARTEPGEESKSRTLEKAADPNFQAMADRLLEKASSEGVNKLEPIESQLSTIKTYGYDPKPFPKTGGFEVDEKFLHREEVAPFEVSGAPGANYLVKLESVFAEDNGACLTFFIRDGETLRTKVPLGVYRLKYVTGENWYGSLVYFGGSASFFQAEESFTFERDSRGYQGNSVQLYRVPNGNLDVDPIKPSEF